MKKTEKMDKTRIKQSAPLLMVFCFASKFIFKTFQNTNALYYHPELYVRLKEETNWQIFQS